jgi:2-isopropylmalate synthase
MVGRHIANRESIVLSVHPHNDRGTAVAAAESAVMAGADRVEGTLFGNGERTGNVDIVTLALNLYTQGAHPSLDFYNINEAARCVEHCNQLPIHPRHPYVGDLVFTAFSGSHQDAIKKGLGARSDSGVWAIPYLPIDPRDVGRTYESVIRVNSQSGKGGIAYLMERDYDLAMPRRLQIEFSQVVQAVTDATGKELLSEQIWELFRREYLEQDGVYAYGSHQLSTSRKHPEVERVSVKLSCNGQGALLNGEDDGPIDALVDALGFRFDVLSYEEHSIGSGSDARAVAFVEITTAARTTLFGVGIHESIVACRAERGESRATAGPAGRFDAGGEFFGKVRRRYARVVGPPRVKPCTFLSGVADKTRTYGSRCRGFLDSHFSPPRNGIAARTIRTW